MNRSKIVVRQIILISVTIFLIICGCVNKKKDSLIEVLILSGKNNHEWQKTTPILTKIYKGSRLFKITVTETPEALTYNDLSRYDVVVSNWNTWPDNDFRMTKEWEHDFMRYVNEGGGVVFIHAGASSFYGWDEYHQMGIGRWGKETSHGKQTKGKIFGLNQSHPITKGLGDFYIVDEIWEKTDIYHGAQAIASIRATDDSDGHIIDEPAVFFNNFGKGRCFFTLLGHNERALLNTGLQTILLRATQWTANRKVTIETPSDLKGQINPLTNDFNWKQTDTTLALLNNSNIIWQYNFRNRFGKPYFHPLTIKNSTLTCVSPVDHPWHLGLWFSWKFINGVNYWEYLNDFASEETGYRSDGLTKIIKLDKLMNPDYSANIKMELQYSPAEGDTILNEKRNIYISPPLIDGSYFIDYETAFKAMANRVILDRTPIEGEPEGKSWGGYAGLSIRFNQDFTSPEIIVPTDMEIFEKDKWLYMGFNTISGDTAGICILKNLNYTTSTTSWYVINDQEIPFFYFSPAVLFDGKIVLNKDETLHLKYRVWILPGKTGTAELQSKYDEYLNIISQHN